LTDEKEVKDENEGDGNTVGRCVIDPKPDCNQSKAETASTCAKEHHISAAKPFDRPHSTRTPKHPLHGVAGGQD
jgi:hypothetical protein